LSHNRFIREKNMKKYVLRTGIGAPNGRDGQQYR